MATANYAIHLDGVSKHWTISDHANLDYATGNAFTFGLWFRPDYDCFTQTKKIYLWSRQTHTEAFIEGGKLFYHFDGHTTDVTWDTGIRIIPEKTYFLCITGSESTNTTLTAYIDGASVATTTVVGGMPDDTDKALYFGVDYGTTSGQFFKGTMTGFFQSNTHAITAANVLTAFNDGVYDIDTTEAITNLVDSIGMEENSGDTYDNALSAGVDGAGVNTTVWTPYLDLGQKVYAKQLYLSAVGECYGKPLIVQRIIWEGEAIEDGDEVKLTDTNDLVVYHEYAQADDTGKNQQNIPPEIWNGLKVVALGHGNVRIQLK